MLSNENICRSSKLYVLDIFECISAAHRTLVLMGLQHVSVTPFFFFFFFSNTAMAIISYGNSHPVFVFDFITYDYMFCIILF